MNSRIAAVGLLCLAGCAATQQAARLTEGMPEGDAITAIRSVGGKEVIMQIIPETETELVLTCTLPDKRTIMIVTSKQTRLVAELSVCDDPARPKIDREWKRVKEIELTNGSQQPPEGDK